MPNAPATFRLHGTTPTQGKSPEATERAKRYRTKAWEATRQRIKVRDGMTCQHCGVLCFGKYQSHVDHITPVVNGGGDEDENLRLLCQSCHNRRTASDQRRAMG